MKANAVSATGKKKVTEIKAPMASLTRASFKTRAGIVATTAAKAATVARAVSSDENVVMDAKADAED